MTDFDVAIVGGGLVGASLACALGGKGLRIALIESVPLGAPSQPSYDDRSVALAWGTRRIFDSMGLWASIAAQAEAITEIQVSDRGHFGAVRLHAERFGVEALGYVVEARVLGRVFTDALPKVEGLEVICPASLSSSRTEDDAVHLSIEFAGGTRELSTRLLIGADGADSMVRRHGGIESSRVDYGQTAVIANVTPELAHRGRAFERFTYSGPLALLPLKDYGQGERCALVWTVRSQQRDDILALSDEKFLSALQARFGNRLGRMLRVGARSAYPLALLRAERYTAERLALIGNAAHTLHPVAGQGFNLGLRDAATLVELIVTAHYNSDDPGAASLLARYEAWRREDQHRAITLTDGLIRIFSSDFAPLVVVRNVGLVALDLIPALKSVLARQTMGIAGRLPRLARGLPL
ncbi:MAG: 2-octaprenyl-6-methoxyphenyl hydroxylase [Chromatiales bacterium]|jgi:2-octaprenyl-6-methoxyphenol hydroxylase|nr:2-octaprenyl-6-methoxyphenyl hydroxylase [Chromatiales bacterium]